MSNVYGFCDAGCKHPVYTTKQVDEKLSYGIDPNKVLFTGTISTTEPYIATENGFALLQIYAQNGYTCNLLLDDVSIISTGNGVTKYFQIPIAKGQTLLSVLSQSGYGKVEGTIYGLITLGGE